MKRQFETTDKQETAAQRSLDVWNERNPQAVLALDEFVTRQCLEPLDNDVNRWAQADAENAVALLREKLSGVSPEKVEAVKQAILAEVAKP